MATVYTDTPHNFAEIAPFVITDAKTSAVEIFRKKKCFFYDTCSFRRHANLDNGEAKYLFEYMRVQNGIFIITRGILMELASYSGYLNREYIQYIKSIHQFGIDILLIYEEDLFTVMEVCFSTNATINSYLTWAVRMLKSPVSTILNTLNQNRSLRDEVIKGKNGDNGSIFARFFQSVREHKEAEDNLGEELLAICLHMLSYIPGEKDGKFCVITDDKGAAGKIDVLFRETRKQFEGKKIIIFSTPKLVQVLYQENILTEKRHIKEILSAGIDGNVRVLGTRIYDLKSREIVIGCDELADLIMEPNGINITF